MYLEVVNRSPLLLVEVIKKGGPDPETYSCVGYHLTLLDLSHKKITPFLNPTLLEFNNSDYDQPFGFSFVFYRKNMTSGIPYGFIYLVVKQRSK